MSSTKEATPPKEAGVPPRWMPRTMWDDLKNGPERTSRFDNRRWSYLVGRAEWTQAQYDFSRLMEHLQKGTIMRDVFKAGVHLYFSNDASLKEHHNQPLGCQGSFDCAKCVGLYCSDYLSGLSTEQEDEVIAFLEPMCRL